MGRRRARAASCDLSITPSPAVKKWIEESDVHIDYVIPHEIIPPNAEAKNNGRAVLFLSVRRSTARVGGESGRVGVSFAGRFGGGCGAPAPSAVVARR